MKTFVIAVVLLTCGAAPWPAERAAAQAVDSSCLALWQYCAQYDVLVPPGISVDSAAKLNPDSVRIDTCEGTLTYRREYAKRTFEVYFQYYIFSDSGYYMDTLVTRQWQDIDTTFSEIRKQMQHIEQRFGQFTLWHRFSYGVDFDTSDYTFKGWYFNFDQYVSADSMLSYLNAMPDIDSQQYGARFYDGLILDAGGGGSSVNLDRQHDGNRVVVWPQPSTNEVFLEGSAGSTRPVVMDIFGRRLNLPIEFLTDSTLRIDLTTVPSGVLFLKFPQQVIKMIVRK